MIKRNLSVMILFFLPTTLLYKVELLEDLIGIDVYESMRPFYLVIFVVPIYLGISGSWFVEKNKIERPREKRIVIFLAIIACIYSYNIVFFSQDILVHLFLLKDDLELISILVIYTVTFSAISVLLFTYSFANMIRNGIWK